MPRPRSAGPRHVVLASWHPTAKFGVAWQHRARDMIAYILRRLLEAVLVVLGVITIVFLLMRLTPGDPARTMLGEYATEQALADLRHALGLDKPLAVQYVTTIYNYVRGDLGRSFRTSQPALTEILRNFPYTLQLTTLSIIISIGIAIPVGMLCAYKRNTAIDYVSMVIALLGISTPGFWLGILLILVFAVWLNWLPAVGAGDTHDPVSFLSHIILPTVTLGTSIAALTTRMTRSCMLEVLTHDYVRTARAKGLRELVVFYRHALKNALIPVITVVGLNFGRLLGGAVVIEVVFARPGLGKLLFDSIFVRDYPQVQATVAFFAVMFTLVNLIVDLTYTHIDPRITRG